MLDLSCMFQSNQRKIIPNQFLATKLCKMPLISNFLISWHSILCLFHSFATGNFNSLRCLLDPTYDQSCRHTKVTDLSPTFISFSSLACAFICWTSMESGFRRRMYSSWLPMQRSRMRLFWRVFVT